MRRFILNILYKFFDIDKNIDTIAQLILKQIQKIILKIFFVLLICFLFFCSLFFFNLAFIFYCNEWLSISTYKSCIIIGSGYTILTLLCWVIKKIFYA